MQYISKVAGDIFTMGFDIILPVSGCILAFFVSLLLFGVRFSSFRRNKRRYEQRAARQRRQAAPAAVPAAPAAAPAPDPADMMPPLPARGDAGMLRLMACGGSAAGAGVSGLFGREMQAALGAFDPAEKDGEAQ